MKKLFIISSTLICNLMFSQVGINTTTPDPSSALDVHSDNKGTLFPRVEITSATDAVTIPNPAKGLMIYKPTSTGTVEEGLYVNVGTPSNPQWDLATNTKKTDAVLTNPAYMVPYENGDPDQYTLYSSVVPTVPLFTSKTVELRSYINATHATQITLPRDGIFALLVRPSYNINYSNAAPRATANAYIGVQFLVKKTDLSNVTSTFDYFRNSFFVRPETPASGTEIVSGPTSTMFISGKAGEKFTISARIENLTDNDNVIETVKLQGGLNSGYTSIAIVPAEAPDQYIQ